LFECFNIKENTVRVAIASGKGGTGKTTVAANLAWVGSHDGQSVTYLDCDVEEPNGHIFLKPQLTKRQPIGVPIPRVDEEKCIHCSQCSAICQYNAIVSLEEKVMVFPELCHSCGGCELVCPTGAITEINREMGRLEIGQAGCIAFVHGLLNIGEAMSPPLIREVKAAGGVTGLVIVDAPPGTSCPVIESVQDSDFVVLVTEPTPFGLHDLILAVEMVQVLKTPFGVVINRADLGDGQTHSYCRGKGIQILVEIPDDRQIAEAYSRGEIASEAIPSYHSLFVSLLRSIEQEVQHNAGQ